MPSTKEFADPDETKTIRVELRPTTTKKPGVFARVEYRRNLVNLDFDTASQDDDEGDDHEGGDDEGVETISFSTPAQEADEKDAATIAARLSELVVACDLIGPVKNRRGEVLVGDDEPIPVDKPHIIRPMALWVIGRIYQSIVQAESPNPPSSRKR